jgi:hypothetical protein
MAKLFSFTAATFLLVGAGSAAFAQSANFEAKGFPISLHQAQVTGSSDIRETTPGATLALEGMPASPHQLAVLSPRKTDDGTRRIARTEHAASAPAESAAR